MMKTATKACSWLFLLEYGFYSFILIIVSYFLSTRKYVPVDAVVVGDVFKSTSETSNKYAIEYIYNGTNYRTFITSAKILKFGDKLTIYIDSKDPTIINQTSKSKVPVYLFWIGIVMLILTIGASFLAPEIVCTFGVLSRLG